MRLFRPCFFSSWFFPDAIFRIKTKEKLLCLTFDDGPDPDSTPCLLEVLNGFNIKAMFFCNGSSAEKYPDLIDQIIKEGHVVGNHGYSHLNGWKTSLKKYTSDVMAAASFTSSRIFRPPYGRLRFKQYLKLKKIYKIVFWDIMPYDFDKSFGVERSLRILENKIRPGSIIVLHDNAHSYATELLNQLIRNVLKEGYRFIIPGFIM